MNISSAAFKKDSSIPQEYSCEGKGINPPLSISNVPHDAKSLVLIVDDPDAPGKTFVHWVLWNISPLTKEIQEGTVPEGAIEGKNSTGKVGFIAPCPPYGTHHYHFTLFALSTSPSLIKGSSKEEVTMSMERFVIEKAEIIGTYRRKL